METHFSLGHQQNNFLTHDDTEFVGHPPSDALTSEIAAENALITIRQILIEDRRRHRRNALPDLAPQVPVEFLEPLPRRAWEEQRGGPASRLRTALQRLIGGRLDARLLFWLAAFVLVLWQPVVVLVTLFGTFWLVLLGHVIFGVSRMKRLRDVVLGLLPSRGSPRTPPHGLS
ncbi:MAG: hypothetical protein COW54_12745 [Rhodobacteraceae bacterium CG17_big_fil_post_rev_8_21_14_2_50_63_15]|nr:MAG: hypothetical protein COW54_12745 [Rhodobacteraceae bacterium CG17_big_fil_post_rev_8_21_14_2_50_63_15]